MLCLENVFIEVSTHALGLVVVQRSEFAKCCTQFRTAASQTCARDDMLLTFGCSVSQNCQKWADFAYDPKRVRLLLCKHKCNKAAHIT